MKIAVKSRFAARLPFTKICPKNAASGVCRGNPVRTCWGGHGQTMRRNRALDAPQGREFTWKH